MATSEILDASRMIARDARIKSLTMTSSRKTSHIASCFSVIDILAVLFSQKQTQTTENRSHVILSKGHAAAGLYGVLDSVGQLADELESFCAPNSSLYGHVNHHASVEIPLSTGSLGHGLPFGLGIAIANTKKRSNVKTFVVISDGELNEGTTWESALIAGHLELQNLVVIIDRNRIQSLGFTEQTLKLDPIDKKWLAFGWNVRDINGHDHEEILKAIETDTNQPLCIVANTIKGKGVSFMENTIEWHYKSTNPTEFQMAINEIEASS
jgi:transketolase